MPHRFRKLNEVVTRVARARSAATAFKLAGQTSGAAADIYWPDLIHVLEGLLPSVDELAEAMADIQRDERTRGAEEADFQPA